MILRTIGALAATSFLALWTGCSGRDLKSHRAFVADASVPWVAAGEQVYLESCAMCHLNGEGSPSIAALRGHPSILGPVEETIRVVLFGVQNDRFINGTRVPSIMSPMGWMEDEEVASVVSYVRAVFGRSSEPIDPEIVARVRATGPARR
jgi:mono/diheme cytochrome c family protein